MPALRTTALLLFAGLVGCFTADSLLGEPCEDDADCNVRLDAVGKIIKCGGGVCGGVCGDGQVLEGFEDCEDGDDDDTDECVDCRTAVCGDGHVWADHEECDDGDGDATDECVECRLAVCGDGHVQAGVEECDDGNDDPGDACHQCKAAVCGDGRLDPASEACDDGDLDDEDGCTAQCEMGAELLSRGAIASARCALQQGTVRCWGVNTFGQLGYGYTTSVGDEPADMPPAVVPLGEDIKNILDIVTGDHTCVLTDAAAANVYCWGRNGEGQTGHDRDADDKIGDLSGDIPPTPVALDRRAVAVVAGYLHTCAIVDDDSLRCWGANDFGQLGDPAVGPAGVDGPQGPVLPDVRRIAAGCYHTCALQSDDSIRCWGLNMDGQLGSGNLLDITDAASSPAIALDPPPTMLAAGCYHSCAALADGTARCWGRNEFGQLGAGDPTPLADPTLAGILDLGRPIIKITAGHSHTCALRDDGAVHCWGANDRGQLGYGDNTHRATPAASPLELGGTVLQIEAARFHTCARFTAGVVRCWGINAAGELGLGHTADIGDSPGELPPDPLRLFPSP